jgi:hypothetical protein
MDYREPDLHIRLPWEATAMILTLLAGLPLLFVGLLFCFLEHGEGHVFLGMIFVVPAVPLLIWGACAIRSRFRKARAAGEACRNIWKLLGWGFFSLGVGIIIVVVDREWLAAPAGFYILPSGIFITALVLMARAMMPASESISRRPASFRLRK